MKRKFSSKRLYKVLIAIVILVTIFCAYGSWDNAKTEGEYFKKWSDKNGACWTQYWDSVDLGKPSNMSKWDWRNQNKNNPVILQQKDWCMAEPNSYYTTYITARKNAYIQLEIAIFLPILFLGGVALYKYLFPKIKQHNLN